MLSISGVPHQIRSEGQSSMRGISSGGELIPPVLFSTVRYQLHIQYTLGDMNDLTKAKTMKVRWD